MKKMIVKKRTLIALGMLFMCLSEHACFSAQRYFTTLNGTVVNVPFDPLFRITEGNIVYEFNWGNNTAVPINIETSQRLNPIQSFLAEAPPAEPVALPVVWPNELAGPAEGDAQWVPIIPDIIPNPEQDEAE